MVTKTMYASVSASGDNQATLDVSAVGSLNLLAVLWAVSFDSITDQARVELHLSKAAAAQFATNNVNDILSAFTVHQNFVTSGMSTGPGGLWHPIQMKLDRQDRLALHALIAGTEVARVHIVTYWL